MRLSSARVAVALFLVLPVTGSSFHDQKLRDDVQVWQSSSKAQDVMWGRCKGWFRKMRSCILEEATCAAHLSQGPADADVEVRLGNLPVFKNHPVYVQWWAARKSEEAYDPFVNPEDAHVYPNMLEAYPRYFDPDFNGGNVQVSPTGEAVIRFRAPATHKMHKHTRIPHVHLRICSGGSEVSIILGRKDKIQLTPQGPVAKSECNAAENKLSVLGFRRLSDYSTTPAPKPLRLPSLAGHILETLDLDPLEFSPAYQCLSVGQYYDHFGRDCVSTCPVGTVISQGQCVRRASTPSSFSAMWHLYVCGCDEACWADKKSSTLHRMRLEIADHLDIPLHEIQELDLMFDARSASPGHASLARMHVRIASPRHSAEAGTAMLRSLFHDIVGSSEVLAMLVLGVRELYSKDLGFLHKSITTGEEDVFAPYYKDLDIVKASMVADHDPSTGQPIHDVAPPPVATMSFDKVVATGLTLAVAGGTLGVLLLTCKRGKVAAREPSLRQRLGEPLSMDSECGMAGSMVAPAIQTDSPTLAPQIASMATAQYLTSLYDRVLQK